MNEFGVPMNDAEMNMMPGSPGKHHLERQMAESGLQMNFDPTGLIIGTAISAVGSIIGGNKSASAARKQAEMANEAAERQLEYDTELWEMSKDKILADRDQAVKVVQTQAENEGKIAAWRDGQNLQKYNYDLMIRNREQTSLENQYKRSTDIYGRQLNLNAMSAQAGKEDELRKYNEIRAEAAFNVNDLRLEQLRNEGKLRARGVAGRSADKAELSTEFELGAQYAALDESVDAAWRNTRSVLEEIHRDKTGADLAAYAQKMLDPGTLPMPIVPFQTPLANFVFPRQIGEYDFGPAPVLGAYMSPSAAANQAWGATISSVAGSIGSMAAAYDYS